MRSKLWNVLAVISLAGCSSPARSGITADSSAHGSSMPPAPVAVAKPAAPMTMVVFKSEGPDDGPGYQIALGQVPIAAESCDYFGHYGEEGRPRMFPTGPYVTLTVADTAARQLPRALPLKGTSLAEAMSCTAADHCETPTSGELELQSFTEGVGATGRYTLELPAGRLEGVVEAVWCGPS